MANLSSAVATGLRVVRATFSAALSDFSASAPTGALNPSNWTLVGQAVQPVPVAAVGALSVVQISTTILDVTTDDDLSPGQPYQITAKDAASGGITGVAAAPNNVATFTAVALTPPAERDFSLLRMIPNMNFREDDTKDLERLLRVFDEPTTLLHNSIDHWVDILDYDLAPDNHLDLMLRSLGYPFQIALSTLDKRRLLSVLVTMFRQKGTVLGIKNAIRFFLGYEADILWPDSSQYYGGWILDVSDLDSDTVLGSSWYFNPALHGPDVGGINTAWDFYAKIGKGSALTADEDTKVRAIIEYTKPAGTHMIGLSSVLPPPATVTATTPVGGTVLITWSAVPGASGYAVFWSKTPAVNALSLLGGLGGSPFPISAPTGEPRYAVVQAYDGSGVGGASSVVVMAVAT